MKNIVFSGLLSFLSVAAFSATGALADDQGNGHNHNPYQGAPGSSVFSDPPTRVIEQPVVLSRDELFSSEPEYTDDIVAIGHVWSAYVWYNDTADGTNMATLFTPNGQDQHVWNDYGTLVPTFGLGSIQSIDRFGTDEGIRGGGCPLFGRQQIAYYFFRYHNPQYPVITFPVLPMPGHSHHDSDSYLVKVYPGGETAMLNATYITGNTNDSTGAETGTTGGYRAFLVKTDEGWQINVLYAISDHPSSTINCDTGGVLPRTETVFPTEHTTAGQ
jgi:hypothetical protein